MDRIETYNTCIRCGLYSTIEVTVNDTVTYADKAREMQKKLDETERNLKDAKQIFNSIFGNIK